MSGRLVKEIWPCARSFIRRRNESKRTTSRAFLVYWLHVTVGRQLRDLAPDLTPRSVIEKFAAVQMIDIHLPTSDGREVVLTRHTQPEAELDLLLRRMKLELHPQLPPKIRPVAIPSS